MATRGVGVKTEGIEIPRETERLRVAHGPGHPLDQVPWSHLVHVLYREVPFVAQATLSAAGRPHLVLNITNLSINNRANNDPMTAAIPGPGRPMTGVSR